MVTASFLDEENNDNGVPPPPSAPQQKPNYQKVLRRTISLILPPCLILSTILSTSTTHPFLNKLRWLTTNCADDGPGPYISVDQAKSNMPGIIKATNRKEPSHVSLCRELIQRHQMDMNGVTPVTTFVKTEDPAVCTDWAAPHYSLMGMMASSVLGRMGERLKMSYTHNCRQTHPSAADIGGGPDLNLAFDSTTIQQIFPDSGLVMEGDNLNIHDVVQLCKGCLSEFQATTQTALEQMTLGHKTHQCLLFPGSADYVGTRHLQSGTVFPLRDLLPTVRDRIQYAATEYNKLAHAPTEEHKSGVIIYLDEMTLAMPFYIYSKFIPPYVSTITVLGTPRCATTRLPSGELCIDHGRALREFFSTFYPSTETRFDIAASTAAAYSRAVLSKSLICPPGTVTCLLPSLGKSGDSHAVVVETPARSGTYHWFESFGEDLKPNIILVEVTEEMLGNRVSDSVTVLMTDPEVREDGCDSLRGKMGYWAADDEYGMLAMTKAKMRGREVEIASDVKMSRNFKPMEESYRSSYLEEEDTSDEALAYKWVETAFPTCQLDQLTLGGLCHIVEMLEIKRIFFVGDALQAQMVLSFWALVNLDDYPGHKTMGAWNRVIDCPNPYNNGQPFELVFVRNDNLNGNIEAEVTQDTINFPWINNYASYAGRTLLVASTGAHQHQEATYQAAVDNFVTMMDELNRQDDIVVYRTSAPGHRDCSESTSGRTDTVGVDQFMNYNHFIHGKLQQRDRNRLIHTPSVTNEWFTPAFSSSFATISATSSSTPPSTPVNIRLMDVYPMTLLHPHGREGLSKGDRSKLLHDCQHDYLPGPPDGWNHLLFTTLVDLVSEERIGHRHPYWE